MTKLAESYFRLNIALTEKDRGVLREFLQEQALESARELYGQEVEIVCFIEEGSTTAKWIVIGSLSFILSQYGSIRTGIDYAIDDARRFSDFAKEELAEIGVQPQQILVSRKRLGIPGKVKRVLERMEKLEETGNSMSAAEYEQEMQLIKKQLSLIANDIDTEQDYQSVVPMLEANFQEKLPSRAPEDQELDQRKAARPKKPTIPKPRYRVAAKSQAASPVEEKYDLVIENGTHKLSKRSE